MMKIIPGLRSSPSQEVLKVVQVETEMKNITVKKKNTEESIDKGHKIEPLEEPNQT